MLPSPGRLVVVGDHVLREQRSYRLGVLPSFGVEAGQRRLQSGERPAGHKLLTGLRRALHGGGGTAGGTREGRGAGMREMEGRGARMRSSIIAAECTGLELTGLEAS